MTAPAPAHAQARANVEDAECELSEAEDQWRSVAGDSPLNRDGKISADTLEAMSRASRFARAYGGRVINAEFIYARDLLACLQVSCRKHISRPDGQHGICGNAPGHDGPCREICSLTYEEATAREIRLLKPAE